MAFNFQEFAKKRVFGVPVLYLALAGVIVLAVVAWKMKPAEEEVTGDENTTPDNVPVSDEDSAAADYSGLNGTGTVTVVQNGSTTDEEAVKETNDDWFRSAVAYLTQEKKATVTEAQQAINKYLEGADLTYAEGQLKDAAVLKLGLPPERLTTVGTVGAAPAQKQFNNFPGNHTVKGSSDNTASKLAALYYGNGDTSHALKIVLHNAVKGPNGTTYNVGDTIKIPAWENPRYYTITKTTQWPSQVAAKNGISVSGFTYLNPGLVAPYKIGSKVRVG